MRTKKPTGNAFVNQAKLQQTQKQAPTKKADATSQAQTAKPATKAQQDQGGFSKSQGPADKPGVNYGQTGGNNPFTGGPLIAVNPMIEPKPTPVEPAINPLPDTVAVEPDPVEPAINPFPEPTPVEPSINPMPDTVAVEPEPVEPAINPFPEPAPVEPAINPLPDTVAVEPEPVEPAINPFPEPAPIQPSINPFPDTGMTPLQQSADRATEIAMQELPFPLVLESMKTLIKDVPELWARMVGTPDDAALTQVAESFLKFGDTSAGDRLLRMASLE